MEENDFIIFYERIFFPRKKYFFGILLSSILLMFGFSSFSFFSNIFFSFSR